jgi:non-ribosomal peptide synthetase component E (peptide arylation enzyme)
MPVFQTRLTSDLIERYTSSGHWGTETFYQILHQRAAAHPDREAIIDHRQRVTYGELRARVDRTAAALQQVGIGPGDVVTIQLPNWAEFAYVFFACERLGAVANQIGPDFRSREVEYILRFSESRVFVCSETFRGFAYVPMIRELRPHLPDLQTVCVLGGPGAPDTVSLDEMISGRSPLAPLVPQAMGANDVMRMAFTSGTTGNPKGVTHSFNTTLPACRILNDAMQVGEHEVFLVYLPLGLNWGYLTLLQAIMVGARAVLLDRFSARAALELIEREHVTFIPSAPASLIAMLNRVVPQ